MRLLESRGPRGRPSRAQTRCEGYSSEAWTVRKEDSLIEILEAIVLALARAFAVLYIVIKVGGLMFASVALLWMAFSPTFKSGLFTRIFNGILGLLAAGFLIYSFTR